MPDKLENTEEKPGRCDQRWTNVSIVVGGLIGYSVAFALTMGVVAALTYGASGASATTAAGVGMFVEMLAFGVFAPLGCLVGSILGFRLAIRRLRR